MLKNLRFSTFALLLFISASSLSACTNASHRQEQSALAATPKSPCFQGASAGFVRPRLAVGLTGHSVVADNLPIRAQPGFKNQILGSLSPSDTFQVVDGPECKDSYVWWQIKNGQVQGWVGEADPATFKYLLAPNNN